MRTGTGIFLITVGAILLFALRSGSPHWLNLQIVGVILILAGSLGLLLPRLARSGRDGDWMRRWVRPGQAEDLGVPFITSDQGDLPAQASDVIVIPPGVELSTAPGLAQHLARRDGQARGPRRSRVDAQAGRFPRLQRRATVACAARDIGCCRDSSAMAHCAYAAARSYRSRLARQVFVVPPRIGPPAQVSRGFDDCDIEPARAPRPVRPVP